MKELEKFAARAATSRRFHQEQPFLAGQRRFSEDSNRPNLSEEIGGDERYGSESRVAAEEPPSGTKPDRFGASASTHVAPATVVGK